MFSSKVKETRRPLTVVTAFIYSVDTSGNARTLPLLPPTNTNTLATSTYRTQSNLHVLMQDQQRSHEKLHSRELHTELPRHTNAAHKRLDITT